MRKRIKTTIMKNEKDFIKFASRPTYIKLNIFGKILVEIHEKTYICKMYSIRIKKVRNVQISL